MSLCDLYGKSNLRQQILNVTASPGVGVSRPHAERPGAQTEHAETTGPALIVVLAPVVGVCFWTGLVYGFHTAF